MCLGNTVLNFSGSRVSTVCSSVIRFTRLNSFVRRGLGGCSDNVRIHLTFSITVGSRNSVLILSRILTINSRTFRGGYRGCFFRTGHGGGAIVLIARSVPSIHECYSQTVLVRSNCVTGVNSPSRVTSTCSSSFLPPHRMIRTQRGRTTVHGTIAIGTMGITISNRARGFLSAHRSFAVGISFRYSHPIPTGRLFISIFSNHGIPILSVPFNSRSSGVSTNGRATRFTIGGILTFNSFHVYVTLRASSRHLRLTRGTYEFRVGKSTTRIVSIIGPSGAIRIAVSWFIY